MFFRFTKFVVLLGCLIAMTQAVGGCTPTREGGNPTTKPRYLGPTDSLDVVLAKINRAHDQVKSINAVGYWEGWIGTKRNDLKWFNGEVKVLHLKPESVKLTMQKAGFPYPLFNMGTDGRKFWMQSEKDTCWYGRVRAIGEVPSKLLPIRPELLLDVIGVASYSTDLLTEPVPTMRYNPDYDAYMITWSAQGGDRWRSLREVWFDRETMHPWLVLLFDPDGRVVVRARLSNFQPITTRDGATAGEMAEQFDILFPETDSNLTIWFDPGHDGIVRDRTFVFNTPSPTAATFNFNPATSGAEHVVNLDDPSSAER